MQLHTPHKYMNSLVQNNGLLLNGYKYFTDQYIEAEEMNIP